MIEMLLLFQFYKWEKWVMEKVIHIQGQTAGKWQTQVLISYETQVYSPYSQPTLPYLLFISLNLKIFSFDELFCH